MTGSVPPQAPPPAPEFVTRRELEEFERRHFRRVGRVKDIKWLTTIFGSSVVVLFAAIYGIGIYYASNAVNKEEANVTDQLKTYNDNINIEITRMLDNVKEERLLRTQLDSRLQDLINSVSDREKTEREKFQSDLKTQFFGKSEGSTLAIYYKDKNGIIKLLDGQEIIGDVYREKDQWKIKFFFMVKNESDVVSGKYQQMLYHNDPRISDCPNSDPKIEFKYEATIGSSNANDATQWHEEIPGRYSVTNRTILALDAKTAPTFHSVPMLFKIFYGQGKSTEARIFLSGSP